VSGAVLRHPVVLFLGFLAVGTAAAVLYAVSTRPSAPPARRRLFGALWVAALLAGGPLWLLVAAMLKVL